MKGGNVFRGNLVGTVWVKDKVLKVNVFLSRLLTIINVIVYGNKSTMNNLHIRYTPTPMQHLSDCTLN